MMTAEKLVQSRWQSWVETVMNVSSGMLIAWTISQLATYFEPQIQYVWPAFHWDVSAASNLAMTIVLTSVSILRSYAWRRAFTALQRKKIEKLINEVNSNRNPTEHWVDTIQRLHLEGDKDGKQ